VPDPAAPDDRPDDRPAWLRDQLAERTTSTPPDPVGGPAVPETDPGPEAVPCYRHPARPTRLRCSRCGRPICGECARPAAVGQLCPDDARDRQRVRGLPGRAAPVVTWTILGVNTLALIVEALLSGSGRGIVNPSSEALCRLGALNAAAIAQSGQWWRLLTVMILHAGVLHFAFNSYALWVFGPELEAALGRLRFLAVYLTAGFTGSAVSFAFNHTPLAVGASGAIFGLLGGLIAYFWRRRDRGGMAQLRGLLFVAVLNLVLSSQFSGIDNLAHVGGLAGGLVSVAMLDSLPRRNAALQSLAIAVPVFAGVLLVAWGSSTFAGGFNCASIG
jgi:membrane associated rhomboid family serine protease